MFGWKIDAAQVQSINPLLILAFIPLFNLLIYPAVNRVWRLTPLRKISVGFFLTVVAFALSGGIQVWIDQEYTPHVAWQVIPFVVLTAAEVLVSITCLEFAYTQAPREMKSMVMAVNLMSVSLGNSITAAVNYFIMTPDGKSKLPGASLLLVLHGANAGRLGGVRGGSLLLSRKILPARRTGG